MGQSFERERQRSGHHRHTQPLPVRGYDSDEETGLYSVSSAEAQDIKATGQFNLAPGGMESKQFGFDLAETRQLGNMIGQNTIVSAKTPTNMLN